MEPRLRVEDLVTRFSSEEGAVKASTNNFQGRYAIRHTWQGAIACKEPRRGVWGGPWPDAGVAGNEIEGHRGVEDLHVVDLADRLRARLEHYRHPAVANDQQ